MVEFITLTHQDTGQKFLVPVAAYHEDGTPAYDYLQVDEILD